MASPPPSTSSSSASDWGQSLYNRLPWVVQKATDAAGYVWDKTPEGVKNAAKVGASATACYFAAPVLGTIAAGGLAAAAIAHSVPPVKNLLKRGVSKLSSEIDRDIDSAFEKGSEFMETVQNTAVAAKEIFDRQVELAPEPSLPSIPLPEISLPDIGPLSELVSRPLPLAGTDLNPFKKTPPSTETAREIRNLLTLTQTNQLADIPEIDESDLFVDEEAGSDSEREELQLEDALNHLPLSPRGSEALLLEPASANPALALNSVGGRSDSPDSIQSELELPLAPLRSPRSPSPLPFRSIDRSPAPVIPEPPSPPVNQPAAKTPAEITAEKINQTNAQIDTFIKNIQSFATLNILHEFVANQEAPEDNLYRRIMQKTQTAAPGKSPPTLWQAYMSEAGKNLPFFQKVKVALCYFFFYYLSGIIPNAIEEFTRNLINTFRNDLTKGPALKNLTATLLQYAETFLNVYSGAIKSYKDENGIRGSLDDYKKRAIDEMIERLFEGSVTDQIVHASEIGVQQFFKPIQFFFKSWTTSRFKAIRGIGEVLSTIVNTPINFIIKTILKKKALPMVIQSLIQETETSNHERNLLISRSIYETAVEQLIRIPPLIKDPNPRKPLPELHGAEKLGTVCTLLVEVLNLTPHETPEAINQALRRMNQPTGMTEAISRWVQDGGGTLIQQGVRQGVEDVARIGLGILHSEDTMEEIFCKLGEIFNSSFSNDESYEDLKKKHDEAKKEFNRQSKIVFQEVIQHSIKEKIEPAFEPVANQTRAIYSNEQQKIQQIFDEFWALTLEMERKIGVSHQSYSDETNVIPEIEAFCQRMGDFLDATTVQELSSNIPGLTPVVREGLDRAFQPLREKAVELIQKINRQKYNQQNHESFSIISQGMEKAQRALSGLRRSLTVRATEKELQEGCDQIAALTDLIRNEISPELAKVHPDVAQAMTKQIDEIAGQAALLLDSRTKVDLANWLTMRGGAIEKVVRHNQREEIPNFLLASALQEIRTHLASMYNPEMVLPPFIKGREALISCSSSAEIRRIVSFYFQNLPFKNKIQPALLDPLLAEFKKGKGYSLETYQNWETTFLTTFSPQEQIELRAPLDQVRSFILKHSTILELTTLIEQMEKNIPYKERSDWGRFTTFILDQVPEELKGRFGEQMGLFSDLQRGQTHFSAGDFEERRDRFLAQFTEQEAFFLASPLNQIHSFLEKNTIVEAFLTRFRDRVEEMVFLDRENQVACAEDLGESLGSLIESIATHRPAYDHNRRRYYRQMIGVMQAVKADVATLLSTAATKIKPERHLDIQPFLTAAGGLGGALAGIGMSYVMPWTAASFLSAGGMFAAKYFQKDRTTSTLQAGAAGLVAGALPMGHIVAPAITGAYVGNQVPKIAKSYGDEVVYPAIRILLDNALKESMNHYSYRGIFLMGLDAFVKAYGKPRLRST